MIINIIDRVKYSFRKEKELLSALHDILGFYPHNLEIYRIALAHKSQAYRNTSGRPLNNERLEFLGDAILEAVVSDIVFHRFERKREGFLTSTRSKIVQRASLNRLAREIGLERLIKTTAGNKSHNCYIGGNAFEALIGAVYLDRGYSFCKWFIEKRIVGRLFNLDDVAREEVNFKSKLLEWTQKNRITSEYKMEETEDAGSNSPVFTSIVTIEGIVAGKGTGYSKKESHQQAAKEALVKLRREPKFLDSIFRAKEKRTAMEAVEICALPKIEELEEEVAKPKKRRSGRRAQHAPSVVNGGNAGNDRQEAAADAADAGNVKPEVGKAATDEATATAAPKRRRGRGGAKRADNAAEQRPEGGKNPAEGQAGQADADPVQTSAGTAPAETAPVRKPRRRKPKPAPAADAGNDTSENREDIIRQAEEAAFRADAS